jgi:hypothetical protein
LAEHWYDLNGALVRIEVSEAALLAPLLSYLNELGGSPAPRTGVFHVTIARGVPLAAPRGAELLYDSSLPERMPCHLSQETDGTRWLLVPDRLSLRYSTSRRKAHIQVAPGAEMLIGGSAGILLLDAVLTASGQVLLHAASLRMPQREAAVAILAPSGVGKTTTALALAAQGFALMTDDATVLARVGEGSGAGLSAWGLPRPLKVHRRTAELLPEIGGVLGDVWNAEGEQSVARTALQSAVEVLPPRPVSLAALIVLGRRVSGQHRLRRVRKADLLALLAADNIFGSRRGVLEPELARFHSLARAATAMPALELNVGGELATLARCVLSTLDPVDYATPAPST